MTAATAARALPSFAGMTRDHRKLLAFKNADALVIDLYKLTTKFPDDERFGLRAQLRRAAVSVATNIVEGSARPPTREYRRFLIIALASARECSYLLDLSARLAFLPTATVAPLIDRYGHVQGALAKIAASMPDG